MSGKLLVTNGTWIIALLAAFFVGTRWNSSQETQSESVDSSKSEAQTTSLSRRSFAPGAAGSVTSSMRSATTRDDGESQIAKLFNLTAFSEGNLEALTLEALKDPNQVKRRLAFARLLSEMTPGNASAIRDQLIAAGAGASEWRDFNYAWGAMGGEEAFNNALNSEQKNLESLISGWAAVDPEGAIAMLSKLPPDLVGERKKLEEGVVAGLADRDRDEATRFVARLASEGREDAGQLMRTVAHEVLRKDGAAEASLWAAGLEDGPLKGSAMSEVAERYVRSDPEAAAGWIEQFADQDYATSAVARVGRQWAEREPLAAVQWLDRLPEGNGQKAGLSSAFGDWEDKDPVAAGEYLLSMPDSPKRDSAVSGFARGYAWQDPETAIAWANDIQDPNLRTESLKQVGSAYFRRKPEEARLWLANSGLPAEVQAEIQQNRR